MVDERPRRLLHFLITIFISSALIAQGESKPLDIIECIRDEYGNKVKTIVKTDPFKKQSLEILLNGKNVKNPIDYIQLLYNKNKLYVCARKNKDDNLSSDEKMFIRNCRRMNLNNLPKNVVFNRTPIRAVNFGGRRIGGRFDRRGNAIGSNGKIWKKGNFGRGFGRKNWKRGNWGRKGWKKNFRNNWRRQRDRRGKRGGFGRYNKILNNIKRLRSNSNSGTWEVIFSNSKSSGSNSWGSNSWESNSSNSVSWRSFSSESNGWDSNSSYSSSSDSNSWEGFCNQCKRKGCNCKNKLFQLKLRK